MDPSLFAQISKPAGAVVGAFVLGLLAVAGGSLMLVVLKHSSFVRNTDVARSIFSRVRPEIFYFGVVAPVWALIGAVIGYQLAGNP